MLSFLKFIGSGKPSTSFFISPEPSKELFSFSNYPNYARKLVLLNNSPEFKYLVVTFPEVGGS